MSTANAPDTLPQSVVPGELVNSFIELVGVRREHGSRSIVLQAAAQVGDDTARIRWLRPTLEGICHLPWHENDMPDGRKSTKTESAARLLWLLCEVLEENTVPPTSIIPTWRGGVTAEWHVNGFDLEIESDPSGTMEYNFVGPGNVEYEGPVDDNLENLRSHVKLLPEERH